jgi:hypothetical protein
MIYDIQKKRRELRSLTVFLANQQGADDGELHVFELHLEPEEQEEENR